MKEPLPETNLAELEEVRTVGCGNNSTVTLTIPKGCQAMLD